MSAGPMSDARREVDPWRFTGSFLRQVISAAIPEQPAHGSIPWTPLAKPLAAAKVALLSSAGLSMKGDVPFDMDMERTNPLRGDPSWRMLRADASSASIDANHLHINTSYILKDLNVALPVDRLRELFRDRIVGAVAETHYSIMGYQGSDTSTLEHGSAPEIATRMRSEEVDLALLAPV